MKDNQTAPTNQYSPRIYGTSLVPSLSPREIGLVTGDWNRYGVAMQELVDRTAMRTKVRVIFAGGRFSLETLPLVTSNKVYDLEGLVERILVSPAETCFQVVDALKNCQDTKEPLILLDLLEPFNSEDITTPLAKYTLDKAISLLENLKLSIPIVISSRPLPKRQFLFDQLADIADATITLDQDHKTEDLQYSLI